MSAILLVILHLMRVTLITYLQNIENDNMSAIMWFEANYMKLNEGKCHFLLAGNTQFLWAKVGEEIKWESKHGRVSMRLEV